MLEWCGGNQRSCVGTKSFQGMCSQCWELHMAEAGNDLLEEPPLNTHKAKIFLPAEGKLLRLHIMGHTGRHSCRGCRAGGHSSNPPRAALPLGHTHSHCSTSTLLPEQPFPKGISCPWTGRRWRQLLQLCCFILLCPQCAITQNTES